MLKITKIIPFFTLMTLLVAGVANAGSCGIGAITEIKEGGWDSNDFMIEIQYQTNSNSHSGTEYAGYIRFKSTLDQNRLKGIKALATVALVSGDRRIQVWSHNNLCSDATELTVFAN